MVVVVNVEGVGGVPRILEVPQTTSYRKATKVLMEYFPILFAEGDVDCYRLKDSM